MSKQTGSTQFGEDGRPAKMAEAKQSSMAQVLLDVTKELEDQQSEKQGEDVGEVVTKPQETAQDATPGGSADISPPGRPSSPTSHTQSGSKPVVMRQGPPGPGPYWNTVPQYMYPSVVQMPPTMVYDMPMDAVPMDSGPMDTVEHGGVHDMSDDDLPDEDEDASTEDKPGDWDPESLLKTVAGPEQAVAGPPVQEFVAKTVNLVWCAKPKDIGKVFEAHLRPENIATRKVDIDEQLTENLSFGVKKRDIRLRSSQGALAAAAGCTVKVMDNILGLQTPEDQGLKQALTHLVTLTMDSLKLMAFANMTLNNIRRDNLRPHLQEKFKSIAKDSPTLDSQFLFGGQLNEKVKAVNEGQKITKSGYRQFGHFHYAAQGRKKVPRQQGFHPYAQFGPGCGWAPGTRVCGENCKFGLVCKTKGYWQGI